jgi:hypothetical protein
LSVFIEERKLRTMTQIRISSPGLPVQRDTARHLIEQAGVALVYLGIVATFAVVTLVSCVIWLLIW